LIVNAYVPPVPAAGVPASVAVPFPLSAKITPPGNEPVSDSTGCGFPVEVTVNVPADPTVNVVDAADVIAGAWFTVNVKDCWAFGNTPFAAVIVMAYDPPVPAAGVPASDAVPFPLSTKVTPVGNAPVSASPGMGLPVAVTANEPADPTVNVVDAPDVIAGAWFTVNVNDCCAFGNTPFAAVIVIGYDPPVPAAGVPASVAVPFPLLVNVTPDGNAPVFVMAETGKPVVVTLNDPAEPTVNVAEAADVIAGAWLTVSVNDWVALEPTPFAAVIVIG
jgi:hypothetical protein